MKRYFARKDLLSAIRSDLANISKEFAQILPDKIEILETKEKKFVLGDGEVLAFESERGFFPTVRGALRIPVLGERSVIVDRGAVSFVVNGADIMRPGVVGWDPNIKANDFVIIREEVHKKAIAVGISLWDAGEFETKTSGKCIKNLHFVGDDIWNMG